MDTLQRKLDFARPPSVDALYLFSMDKAKRELEEIREEVADTGASTEDVEFVPESAYTETLSLLARLHLGRKFVLHLTRFYGKIEVCVM